MVITSYIIIYVLSFLVLIGVCFYVYKLRSKLDEMHGMMVAMTLGMVSGLVISTLYVIPTGNFLFGFILGSVIGLIFGIGFGKLGNHLGIMEGVVAGPMGGMMGAMLGQMIRPFNINIFMPFFVFIFLITMLGISYAVNCGYACCGVKSDKKAKTKVSLNFIYVWVFVSIVLLLAGSLLNFSLLDKSNDIKNSGLPKYIQELTKEVNGYAVLKSDSSGTYQDIDLIISNSRYSPNVIYAKVNVPLRINVRSEFDAGCASEVVFPDFGIDKIISPGSSSVIVINPDKVGTFGFRCAMDMARGKLIVSN